MCQSLTVGGETMLVIVVIVVIFTDGDGDGGVIHQTCLIQ